MKIKLSKTMKVVMVALVAFTSLGIFNGVLYAEENFNISSEVIYSEDNKEAIITLDASNIIEDYTLESVSDPDGNTMDLTNLTYKVNENGTYNFHITYFDLENERYEYTETVEVSDIAVEKEETYSSHSTIDRSGLTRDATGTDYTDIVEIVSWDFIDSNKDALSTTNPAKFYTDYQLVISWKLKPENAFIKTGDYFSFPLPKNETSGSWQVVTTDWGELWDSTNTEVLGRWRITSTGIEVELTENSNDKMSITGSLESGTSSFKNATTVDITQNVSIGNSTKEITFNKANLSRLQDYDLKYASGTSNTTINWAMFIGNEDIYDVVNGNEVETGSVYFEDQLSGKVSLDNNGKPWINISAPVQVPMDLTSGEPSGITAGGNDVTGRFTYVEQDDLQSYEEFKASLAPQQYGVYVDDNGIQTVLINFGDIKNSPVKYSSNFAKEAADYSISSGFYTEDDRDDLEAYFQRVYGTSNSYGGSVIRYRIGFNEVFDKVVVNTEKTNTAIITKGNDSYELTGKGVLQGISGSANVVAPNAARVFLSDEETQAILDGVSVTLQKYNSATNIWEDSTDWSGLIISEDGYVDTGLLNEGTYRFVQNGTYSDDYDLSKSKGYDSVLKTVISDEFTVVYAVSVGHTVYMTNIKKRFTVTYKPGEQGTFADNVHADILIHSATPEYSGAEGSDGNPAGNKGYTFDGWDKTIKTTVTEDATYEAKWKANTDTKYKVQHYLETGHKTNEYTLDFTDELTGTTGDMVDAVAKTTYEGYTLDKTVTGTLDSGTIAGDGSLVLKLYYRKNATDSYTVKHFIQDGDDSTSYNLYGSPEVLSATVGTTVSANYLTIPGYTANNYHVDKKESGVVEAGGTLTLSFYYNANIVDYEVEHYLENSEGTYDLDDTEYLSGPTGATANAVVRDSYAGYTHNAGAANTLLSGTITADGKLVLKVYYDADIVPYKVVHKLEQEDGSFYTADTDNGTAKIGKTVNGTDKTFDGYTYAPTHAQTKSSGVVTADGKLTLVLIYTADATTYNTSYYLQDGSDPTKYNLEETISTNSKTGYSVTAVINNYEGYTHNPSAANTKLSGTVEANGTLHLHVYYDANTDTRYKVEHYLEQSDGSYVVKDTENLTGKTNTKVTAVSKTYAGYTFNNSINGTLESGIVASDGSLVLKLYYTVNEHPSVAVDAGYKVEHYLQQTDGSYKLEDKESFSSPANTIVTAIAKQYKGYTFNKNVDGSVLSGMVYGDGSLVLKVFYTKDDTKKDQTITIKPSVTPEGTTGANPSVATGDTTNTNVLMLTMISMLGVIIALRKKKRS